MIPPIKSNWFTGRRRWRRKPLVGISWGKKKWQACPAWVRCPWTLPLDLFVSAHQIAPWLCHGVRYLVRGQGIEGYGCQEQGAGPRLSPRRSREASRGGRKLHLCLPGSQILQTSFLQNYLGFMCAWLWVCDHFPFSGDVSMCKEKETSQLQEHHGTAS